MIANNSSYLFCTCEVLWDIAGESKNYNMLTGHKNAVLEVKWSPSSGSLVSCSADKTVGEKFSRSREENRQLSVIAQNHLALEFGHQFFVFCCVCMDRSIHCHLLQICIMI